MSEEWQKEVETDSIILMPSSDLLNQVYRALLCTKFPYPQNGKWDAGTSCPDNDGCSTSGSLEGQIRWDFEQAGLLECIHLHGRRLEFDGL